MLSKHFFWWPKKKDLLCKFYTQPQRKLLAQNDKRIYGTRLISFGQIELALKVGMLCIKENSNTGKSSISHSRDKTSELGGWAGTVNRVTFTKDYLSLLLY